jgi:hypothetical protein
VIFCTAVMRRMSILLGWLDRLEKRGGGGMHHAGHDGEEQHVLGPFFCSSELLRAPPWSPGAEEEGSNAQKEEIPLFLAVH